MDQVDNLRGEPPNVDFLDSAIPLDVLVQRRLSALSNDQLVKLFRLIEMADDLDAALAFMGKIKVHCPVAAHIASQK